MTEFKFIYETRHNDCLSERIYATKSQEKIYRWDSQGHLNSGWLDVINRNLLPEWLHMFQNINLWISLNLGILSSSKYFRNKFEEMIWDG